MTENKIINAKNIMLISHNDLDGYGSNILLQYICDKYDISLTVKNCTIPSQETVIENMLFNKSYKDYDIIFITDLSICDGLAKRIDSLEDNNFLLFDHHVTAEYLNKYDWCNVSVCDEDDNKLTSGTYMLYKFLVADFNICFCESLCKTIRYYDTWLWKEEEYDICKDLNDLFLFMGPEYFMDMIFEKYNETIEDIFDEETKRLLMLIKNNTKNYCDRKMFNVSGIYIDNYLVGTVMADMYTSELGARILNEGYDIAAIISPTSISFRSAGDIDVSKIASKLGGGGHKNASGARISLALKNKYINDILSIEQ